MLLIFDADQICASNITVISLNLTNNKSQPLRAAHFDSDKICARTAPILFWLSFVVCVDTTRKGFRPDRTSPRPFFICHTPHNSSKRSLSHFYPTNLLTIPCMTNTARMYTAADPQKQTSYVCVVCHSRRHRRRCSCCQSRRHHRKRSHRCSAAVDVVVANVAEALLVVADKRSCCSRTTDKISRSSRRQQAA